MADRMDTTLAELCQPWSQTLFSSKSHFTWFRLARSRTRRGATAARHGRLLVLGIALAAAACGGGEDSVQVTEATSGAIPRLAATTSSIPTTTTTTPVAPASTTATTATTIIITTTMAGPTVADVYSANCAACHGAELEGGVGPELGPGGHAHGHSDAELVAIVTNGKNAMPAFVDKLTEEQIVDLVSFIREADDNS